jgi:23S rRNA (pseudouridine1915-N3)-methyltransferase
VKVSLIAVGKIKKGVFEDLYELYKKRISFSIHVKEIELRENLSDVRRVDMEGEQILKLISADSYVIALDEKGVQLTSQEFAEFYGGLQTKSFKDIIFVIGGAYGLSEVVRKRANTCLAFGTLTWPHLLVRSLLIEQLYRAQQILAGHPYHKN